MPTTHIHFLLDRSGSMDNCLDDTIGGFNSFIRNQKDNKIDNCSFSLYQFDHQYTIVYTNKPIEEVEPLNKQTFVPRGNTALHDAIGRTIKTVAEYKYEKEDKIVIVILTDGFENSSREYNSVSISNLITKYDQLPEWSFVFLAANQDAITTAGNLGISHQSAMQFSQKSGKIQDCYTSLSQAFIRLRETPGNCKFLFTQEEQSSAI